MGIQPQILNSDMKKIFPQFSDSRKFMDGGIVPLPPPATTPLRAVINDSHSPFSWYTARNAQSPVTSGVIPLTLCAIQMNLLTCLLPYSHDWLQSLRSHDQTPQRIVACLSLKSHNIGCGLHTLIVVQLSLLPSMNGKMSTCQYCGWVMKTNVDIGHRHRHTQVAICSTLMTIDMWIMHFYFYLITTYNCLKTPKSDCKILWYYML